jgi:hypothetical protein
MPKSSLRRALNLGRITGRKTEAGKWEVDEASLLAAYPPPGDAPESRLGSHLGSHPESGTGNDQLVALLRDSLEREREINRQLQTELERERADRDHDRALFRDLADQWRRQLPAPDAAPEAPRRRWW